VEVGVPALKSQNVALTPPPCPSHKGEGNRSRSILTTLDLSSREG